MLGTRSRQTALLAALLLASALAASHAHTAGPGNQDASASRFCPECALVHAPATVQIVCLGSAPPAPAPDLRIDHECLPIREPGRRPAPSRAPPVV